MKLLIQISFVLSLAVLVGTGCQQASGNTTGSEYMPDMAHSIAYEANVYNYYYNNTWGTRDDYYKMSQPRIPVKGTVPRSTSKVNGANMGNNYGYADTEEERTRAMNEIIDNPLAITDSGLAQGKELYTINCGICHGDKGDGAGYLVREADPAKGIEEGKYPVQPANFLLPEFLAASNGRYYHSIMHGKNLMGSYSDKLNATERWNVIHYIRSVQAKDQKLAYNQMENTFNTVDRPAGKLAMIHTEEMHGDMDGHNTDGDHGHGHEHGEDHHEKDDHDGHGH